MKYKVTGAVLSNCSRYRYDLYRRWRAGEGYVLWVMLNPSTADGEKDDLTISKCRGFSNLLGYGAMHIANLFAFRTTYPKHLLSTSDPVGELNNYHTSLNSHRTTCRLVIVAWGSLSFIPEHHALRDRAKEIMAFLPPQLMCLGTTKSGDPRHPARLGYSAALVPFTFKEAA